MPPNGVLLAAQLACPDGAYITRDSALGYHKVRGQYLRKIEIAVPGRSVRKREPPIDVRATTAPPQRDELTHNGPLRVAKVPRALLDLAPDSNARKLNDHITEAIHQGKLNHAEMRTLIERYKGHAGVGELKRAYAYYLPRRSSRSGFERAFDRGLDARPWIPDPARNVHQEAGGVDWEIDRFWPDYGVAAELDHRDFHEAERDREKDMVKDAKLAAIGIVVVRFTSVRFEVEPAAVYDDLEDILHRRGWPDRRRAA